MPGRPVPAMLASLPWPARQSVRVVPIDRPQHHARLQARPQSQTPAIQRHRHACPALHTAPAGSHHSRGWRREGHRAQHAKKRLTARERIALLLDPGTDLLRARPVGRLGDVRRVGRRARRRASSRGSARVSGRLRHDRRQRRHREGRRLLPDDRQEGAPRPAHRHGEPPADCSTSSIPPASSCRCRTRSSPTRTTSAASSATTPSCPPRASRRSRPSWAMCVAGGALSAGACATRC